MNPLGEILKRKLETIFRFEGKPTIKKPEMVRMKSSVTGNTIEMSTVGMTWLEAVKAAKSALDKMDEETMAPKKGESWVPIADGDPFPPKIRARILEYKDGWVRYELGSLIDERSKLESFLRVYRKETPNDPGR